MIHIPDMNNCQITHLIEGNQEVNKMNIDIVRSDGISAYKVNPIDTDSKQLKKLCLDLDLELVNIRSSYYICNKYIDLTRAFNDPKYLKLSQGDYGNKDHLIHRSDPPTVTVIVTVTVNICYRSIILWSMHFLREETNFEQVIKFIQNRLFVINCNNKFKDVVYATLLVDNRIVQYYFENSSSSYFHD